MNNYKPALFNVYLVPNRPCAPLCEDNKGNAVQLGYSERTGDYRGSQEETEE